MNVFICRIPIPSPLLHYYTNNGNVLSRCELVFENCFVPEENVLGQEGKGLAFPDLILLLLERNHFNYAGYLIPVMACCMLKFDYSCNFGCDESEY